MAMAMATMRRMIGLKCVTVDVTGTLLAYKGELGDYYCMSAKALGLPCPDYTRVHEGFKSAYSDLAKRLPCFGFGSSLSNMDWWRLCVRDSFQRAGYSYDDETAENIFKRIYALFGSTVPYTVFPDAQPFLRWARAAGFTVGIVSNAEARYRDAILPALGLNKGSEWDFGVFSGVEGVEKPNPKIYELALERAGGIQAGEALHIGDSFRKDYRPATTIGMHALLLDRFNTPDAKKWKESGVPVLSGLVSAKTWIIQNSGVEQENPNSPADRRICSP